MGYATGEPREFVSGDTVKWERNIDGKTAADGWGLVYSFRGNGVEYDYTATASGTSFELTIEPADSALLAAGDYTVAGYAQKMVAQPDGSLVIGERHTVFEGRMSVKANLFTAGATFDGRSHVKKVLDAIEAVLENRASKEILTTNIEGVSISNIPHGELMQLREKYLAYYKQELAAENLAAGGATGARILTRFN